MFGNDSQIEIITQPLYSVGVLTPPFEGETKVRTKIEFFSYVFGNYNYNLKRYTEIADCNLYIQNSLPAPHYFLLNGFELRLINDRSRKLLKMFKTEWQRAHVEFILGNKLYFTFPFLQLLYKPESLAYPIHIPYHMSFRLEIEFRRTFDFPITVLTILRGGYARPVQ